MEKIWLRLRTLTWKHLLAFSFTAFLVWVCGAAAPSFLGVLAVWMQTPDRVFPELVAEADDVYADMLGYDGGLLRGKSAYIDFNGLMARLTGQRVMNDVVRLNNGYLADAVEKRYDTAEFAANLLTADAMLRERGIPLLYVNAPGEICKHTAAEQLPAGVVDYSNDNADALLDYLAEHAIPSLDLREELPGHGLDCYQALYKTDHHWTFEAAFLATHIILERLEALGYTQGVDGALYDPENCSYEDYSGVFLGSMGKRVGRHFGGLDDVRLIIPNVDMEFELIAPAKALHLTGSFEEVFIDRSMIVPTDLYEKSAYSAYHTGFDMHILNHNAASGGTLLLMGDSYNVPIRAFAALHFEQVIFLYRPTLSGIKTALNEYDPDVAVALFYRGAPQIGE